MAFLFDCLSLDMCVCTIQHGAQWKAKDQRGRTALDMAKRNKCEECLAVLQALEQHDQQQNQNGNSGQ